MPITGILNHRFLAALIFQVLNEAKPFSCNRVFSENSIWFYDKQAHLSRLLFYYAR